MKKVKSIFKKALALKDNIMKKLKEIIKAGLKDMGNDALRAWGYDTK